MDEHNKVRTQKEKVFVMQRSKHVVQLQQEEKQHTLNNKHDSGSTKLLAAFFMQWWRIFFMQRHSLTFESLLHSLSRQHTCFGIEGYLRLGC